MIYSPLHPVQSVGKQELTQVPALFITTSAKTAVMLGIIFLSIACGISIFLGFYAHLGLVYIVPAVIMGLFAVYASLRFLQDWRNFAKGLRAFGMATYFMLALRAFILIAVLVPY